MFVKMKFGLMAVVFALSLFLFIGCDTPLDDSVENNEIFITTRAIGDTLANVTQNGVTFVVVQQEGNLIRLNMVTSSGPATVNYTVKTYTFGNLLYNSVTKTNTLYSNVSQTESFYFPTLGSMSITINSVTR
jgi:hypothetical protein